MKLITCSSLCIFIVPLLCAARYRCLWCFRLTCGSAINILHVAELMETRDFLLYLRYLSQSGLVFFLLVISTWWVNCVGKQPAEAEKKMQRIWHQAQLGVLCSSGLCAVEKGNWMAKAALSEEAVSGDGPLVPSWTTAGAVGPVLHRPGFSAEKSMSFALPHLAPQRFVQGLGVLLKVNRENISLINLSPSSSISVLHSSWGNDAVHRKH